MPPAERRRIRGAMADTFGRTMIEIMTSARIPGPRRLDRPDRARLGRRCGRRGPTGRGALLVSGHFGQWEAVRASLKANGIEVGGVYPAGQEPAG